MDALAYLRFPLALVFVLALLGLAVWVLRRVGWPTAGGSRAGRLRLIESLALDPKRRVVLVRRDEVEHVLVVGPEGVVALEGGIAAPGPKSPQELGNGPK